MSGDFRKFPELRSYDDVASPQPGQHGTYWTPAHLPSPEATPTFPLLCSTHKCREGVEL